MTTALVGKPVTVQAYDTKMLGTMQKRRNSYLAEPALLRATSGRARHSGDVVGLYGAANVLQEGYDR